MQPKLRSIGTVDLDGTVVEADGTFSPLDKTHFAVLIDAQIGAASEPGQDLFQFTVCTPSWMENEVTPGGTYWLRHYLLLEKWNHDAVVLTVSKLCGSINEPSWNEVATKLGRYMAWEFEDYQP